MIKCRITSAKLGLIVCLCVCFVVVVFCVVGLLGLFCGFLLVFCFVCLCFCVCFFYCSFLYESRVVTAEMFCIRLTCVEKSTICSI